MKKIILISTILLTFLNAKPTEINYELSKKYIESNKSEILKKAKKEHSSLFDISIDRENVIFKYYIMPEDISGQFAKDFKVADNNKYRTYLISAARMFIIKEFKNKFKNNYFLEQGFNLKFELYWKDTKKLAMAYMIKPKK